MQFPGRGTPPLGVIYCTTMSRPDAALALAMLHGFEGKREARVGAVAVSHAGLGAAIFCDAVSRFYQVSPGPPANSNRLLPVGLAADRPLPPDPPMVKAAIERRNDKGEPAYVRSVRRISDTSELTAMIRNAVTAQSEKNSVLILSAPATYLARSMALPTTKELMAARVKALVVVDSGQRQDAAALRKVLADWPTQVVFCGRDAGEVLKYPASSIEKDFAWTPAHPVADAYRSFQPMPYDAPTYDLAAMLYAVHPDQFQISDSGVVQVSEEGRLSFAPSADGKHRALRIEDAKKDSILQTYVTMVNMKPVPRVPFRPSAGQQQQQQQAPPAVKPAENKPAENKTEQK